MNETFNIFVYGITAIAITVVILLFISFFRISKYDDALEIGEIAGKEDILNSIYVWISNQLKREDLHLESPETMLDLLHDWAEEERSNLYGQENYTANFIYTEPENREKESIDIRDLWNKELEEE